MCELFLSIRTHVRTKFWGFNPCRLANHHVNDYILSFLFYFSNMLLKIEVILSVLIESKCELYLGVLNHLDTNFFSFIAIIFDKDK